MSLLDDLVAAVEAGGVLRVYKLGEVPAAPKYPYSVVSLGSPDKPVRTMNGDASDLYRATVQHFGRDADGVLDIANLGDLDGTFVAGRLVTRELSTPPYRDPDDRGVLNVLHTYRL